MTDVDSAYVPARHRVLLVTAPVLLALYLLAAATVAIAVSIGRLQVELLTVMFSVLPVVAFAVPIWTAYRRRRVTDPGERHELFRRIVAELVLGLVFVISCGYQVAMAPGSYFTIL
ncbi:MAG TPA: hypothetical protein VN408_16445 [Actinoplanes sp.]|nr:hypothetical protein [Actinoplanes sp.]